jgi:hypothetical protein
MMNGDVVLCKGTWSTMVMVNKKEFPLNCLVSNVVPGYGMLLGMDAITILGGVYVSGGGRLIRFGCDVSSTCAVGVVSGLQIEDQDFSAKFEDGKWVVKYNWVSGGHEPVLYNTVAQYKVQEECSFQYEAEVEEWIANGWLQAYEGEDYGIIPLMAVLQLNKAKVRPVLDFRELNQFVSSHTATSDVCGEKLREWRRMGSNVSIIDLKKAYLQLHVDQSLWKYQVVRYKGKRYCLTRLGFGLNVAPKIMTAVLKEVLGSDRVVRAGTDSYVDDIIVNQDVVSVGRVLAVLKMFGLEAKCPEPIDGGRVLGLKVMKKDGTLTWKRDNMVGDIKEVGEVMTRRQVFSWCGQLIGHYPVAGWLRPACGFVKRQTNGSTWDEVVEASVVAKLRDIDDAVKKMDPIGGRWEVSASAIGRVWCDASSLAVGVCLEIDGSIVEDNCWLRKKGDTAHINVVELESVIKVINMCMLWKIKSIEVMSDSMTVWRWIQSILVGDKKVKVHGLSEMLIKRRLLLLQELITESGLNVSITLVKSCENKADALTRVPKQWLKVQHECLVAQFQGQATTTISEEQIKQAHCYHHFGFKRTLYLLKLRYPKAVINEHQVHQVIRQCSKCLSLDPAPIKWTHGELQVKHNWRRLACDVTHYQGSQYLTVVDCGPSRFSIWRKIMNESAAMVATELEEIFRERGPPDELLLDNARSFKSASLKAMCDKWSVTLKYRCAYRAGGNAIVERNHRTIKRMATRAGADVRDMVFYYNLSPTDGTQEQSVPSNSIFSYKWKHPAMVRVVKDNRCDVQGGNQYQVGDSVFVKKGNARCTTLWPPGVITNVRDSITVEVDGMPRHIADVRKIPEVINQCERANIHGRGPAMCGDVGEIHNGMTRTSGRIRRQPRWMDDYVVGNDGNDGSNDDEDIMGAYDDLMATPV